MATTSQGFNLPALGSPLWGTPTNANWSRLDQFLSGSLPIGALSVSGNVTVAGSITAGSFIGLDGTFLTSALFNVANGIPRLNGAGLIPSSLLTTQGIVTVTASATPTFDFSSGAGFEITLAQNQTPTFANIPQGPALVGVRVIQTASGGPYTFTWPASAIGAGIISPVAGKRSMQMFMRGSDGNLYACAPMVYA